MAKWSCKIIHVACGAQKGGPTSSIQMVKVTGFDGQPYMAMIVSTGLNIEATMSCIKRSFLSYGLIVVIRITTHYAYTRTHNTHSFLFKTSHGKALTHHGFSL